MSLVRIQDLTKRFGGLIAVNDVSFDVEEGEILSVIGPNGAGKSTLFNLISGLDRPSAGDVVYRGRSLAGLRPDAVCRLGIAKTSMDNLVTSKAADAIRALNQRLVQLPTIGGGLPFGVFSDSLALPTIGLAVVNFDNNQHAANENIRVGHFWEAIEIFAALVTMPH